MNVRSFLLVSLLALSALALILVARAGNWPVFASTGSSSPRYSPEVVRGAELYVSYACVRCHGLGGHGRELMYASGPSLVSSDFKRLFPEGPKGDAALVQIIKNGSIIEGDSVASMPSWNGVLGAEGIADIVAYIRAGLPDLQIPVSLAETGEEIYAAFACGKCHGEVGKGGDINLGAILPEDKTIPTLGGQAFRQRFTSRDEVANVILHGKLVESGRAGVVYMPAWGRIATAEQVDRVVRYLWDYAGR